MTRWVLIQHVEFEVPGSIAATAREAGIELDVVHVWRGDAVPALDGLAGLIVMGGPMGALDDYAYPHLAEERALLREAVDAGLPVLGVCLGAQLLAVALGAELVTGGDEEIGVGEVRLVADSILGARGESLPVVHWHADTFSLPDGATLLASSDLYEHQAFAIGSAVGLQFHVEATDEWTRSVGPHLPPGVALEGVSAVAEGGVPVLRRFFTRGTDGRPSVADLLAR